MIITIIVLLILAGVSISMVIGDNGILTPAVNATVATDVADTKEQIQVALVGYYDENGDYTIADVEQAVSDSGATLKDDGVTATTSKGNTVDIVDLIKNASDYVEPISTDESFVGYYADVDGDGTVDGIIYVDLMHEQTAEYWSPGSTSSTYITYGTYSWDTITSSKDYYISQESYTDDFGTKAVIAPISGSTGNDRFYVMALDDFTTDSYSTFYWYYGLTSFPNTCTGSNTLAGSKTLSEYWVSYWNASTYGTQNAGSARVDLWSVIQDKVTDGWYLPTRCALNAFCSELGITSDNYSSFNLYSNYWSCSYSTTFTVSDSSGTNYYYYFYYTNFSSRLHDKWEKY